MRAFVQQEQGEWINDSCYQCARGLRLLGYEIIPFEASELDELPLDREAIVHGGVTTVRRALRKIGVPSPPNIDLPPDLMPFFGRRISQTTMSEVRRLAKLPLFIKPLDEHKLFDGHVVHAFRDLIGTAWVAGDVAILASEVVCFVVEYRVFVRRKTIVGCKHYRGDWRVTPDFSVVDTAVDAWQLAPVSWGLDVGVTMEGRTLIVEVNDGFALGHYGLDALTYARMVEERWQELVRQV